MTPSVFVDPGAALALDRPSLSAPAPHTPQRLVAYCEQWASQVGWRVTGDQERADAVLVGPGVAAGAEALRVLPGQGIDGFRWAIRSLAFRDAWPVEEARYGPLDDHVCDVRKPEADRRGVVVLLHGGFWMDAWRRTLMDGIAVDLVRRGFETWNAEYRRVGSGGGWPATLDDVMAAVEAACAGSGAGAVTIVGHSAGGHLALEAAHGRPAAVERAVSLAGLCDLAAATTTGVGGGAVERFLGGAAIDAASPIAHVPLRAPAVLAHCADDTVVPVDQSRRYAAAAQSAGAAARLLVLERGDHMSLIEPENGWGEIAPRLFAEAP